VILNSQNLTTLNIAFNAAFSSGFAGYKTQWADIATRVPSTTAKEEYGWLNQLPGMREWIGDRQVNNIALSDYSIKNKTWEDTVKVPVEAIEDDTYGVYSPLMSELGRAGAAHPDQLIFPLLKNGFATACYDGQYFFDTDHPVLDADGNAQSVANTDGGAGTPWFVLDTSRALKPLILQMRRDLKLTPKIDPTSENVFNRKEFVWGADGRWNAGFGFWQMAWGSKQTLDETHLTAAITGLGEMKGDFGRPLGISPRLLVVPPSLEFSARKLIMAANNAAGASNVLNGRLEMLVSPWLA
jgi:phage major head subunit gpT-like protein